MMRTDISIISPHDRLIIDTKFYREALAGNQGGALKFVSDNLYQIYAYLRTQEGRGENFLKARGMLLYPTVNYELNERMNIQGHEILVSTLDLAKPWELIEERLLRYVEPLIPA